MRRLDWADYRTTEFEGLDPEKVIAILPTAAIEQHGPHLPVMTDTRLGHEVAVRAARKAYATRPTVVTPVVFDSQDAPFA